MSDELRIVATGARLSRRLEKLYGKVRSINFYKIKVVKNYQKWDSTSVEIIDALKKIEEILEKYLNTSNSIKIGGEISTIVGGLAFICGMLTGNYKNVSVIFERIGKGFTAAGVVAVKGCNIAEKALKNNSCTKAKRHMDRLKEITQELENDRKVYFRLVKEYEALLDALDENELQEIYTYLEENDMEYIRNDTDLDSSVENRIPPNVEEMKQLTLDEDIMNVKIFQFNLIPKISEEMRNHPLLKNILSMKCESLPFLSGENAVKSVQALTTIQNVTSVVNLMPINSNLPRLNGFDFIAGSAKIGLLVDSISNLMLTVSNRGQVSEQSEEIERVVNELKHYRSEIKEILSKSLKWDCFEDDSLGNVNENNDKRD